MSVTVFSYPNNPRVWKAAIAGKYNDVNVESPAFNFGVDNKTAEFVKQFPFGKVPAATTSEGPLFESNAIARYVARQSDKARLYGSNVYESALVDQWIDAFGELDNSAHVVLMTLMGYLPYNKAAYEKGLTGVKGFLATFDKVLATRTYLVGNRVTLADIVAAMSLYWPMKMFLDATTRMSFVNVSRYYKTLVNQPNFKAVIGEVTLCEVIPDPTPRRRRSPRRRKSPRKRSPRRSSRRKRRSLMRTRSPRPRTPWTSFPPQPSTSRSTSASTPTMTPALSPSPSSSRPSMLLASAFSSATTSTTASSPRLS
eukprot:TRINITY_DN200_c0_g1_i7.p1 TRINITY_DN200_c0_g1~~TRINITY_DN200_c0_g1_i7.p1  ORF type:complete len:335 (+),score=189.84 TRINITY_DN200_c0_g1_i7:71-1006(+)